MTAASCFDRLSLDLLSHVQDALAAHEVDISLRERWPKVRIILTADSGFAREELIAWCEANGVDYVLGLARNARPAMSAIRGVSAVGKTRRASFLN